MISCIIGSTASGKSEIAMSVARETGAHILSCDSLLVYSDLNVGTAKPSEKDLSKVPHYGINLVEASTNFTAGDYVRYARPIIDRLVKENMPLLIVGGTGFYLKSLLFGVWDAPPADLQIRKKIEEGVAGLAKEDQAKKLHDDLSQKDPDYAEKIPPGDIYRVIRALEIIESSGVKASKLSKEKKLLNPLPYPFKIFGIERGKQDLERRISARMNEMFQNGFVSEVETLLKKYEGKLPRAMNCVGYSEVSQFIEGKMTIAECRERILISTRQLAKKQRTFFNGMFKDSDHSVVWTHLPSEQDALSGTIKYSLK